MFDFSCQVCGHSYHGEEAHLGRAIQCVQCGSVVQISHGSVAEVIVPPARNNRTSGPSENRIRYNPISNGFGHKWLYLIALLIVCIVGGILLTTARPSRDSGSLENRAITPKQDEPAPQKADRVPIDKIYSAPAIEPRPDQSPCLLSNVSLANGARVEPDLGKQGRGVLVVHNGNDEDAVVRVIEQPSDITVRWVYVTKNSRLTLNQIAPGSYSLLFATGSNWDDANTQFGCDAEYYEMGKTLAFEEKHLAEAVEFERHTITLHRVLGGNIARHQIAGAEFKRNRHKNLRMEARP